MGLVGLTSQEVDQSTELSYVNYSSKILKNPIMFANSNVDSIDFRMEEDPPPIMEERIGGTHREGNTSARLDKLNRTKYAEAKSYWRVMLMISVIM